MEGGHASGRRRGRRAGASSGTWAIEHSTQKASVGLVRTVTHDLRSPATAIQMGISELARRIVDDEENRRLALLVAEYAERALAVADDVADLVALQSGVFAPSSSEIDLAALVEELLGDLRTMHGDPSFERPADRFVVRGDNQRLRRVLSGLIAEARLRARTTVNLRLYEEDGFACVGVVADGHLGSVEQLDALLDARRRPCRFGVGHGLGIRLAIARDVVAAHDGTIDVNEAPGGGVSVTVRLPLF